MRVVYLKWIVFMGLIAVLGGCGGGSGSSGSESDHLVNTNVSCADQSRSEDCSITSNSQTFVTRVSDGSRITFKIKPVPGHITHIETSCGVGPQLENVYNADEFNATQGTAGSKIGELRGDTYSTAPINSNCSVRALHSVAYKVTADPGLHGSISPEQVSASSNSLVEFRVKADDGYVVGDVLGCGSNGKLNDNLFILQGIPGDCQLTVRYLEIPDMAGLWSGTWEGIDSAFGPVAGTWVMRMSQDNVLLKGPIDFSGDLDCAEGSITGEADPRDESIGGTVKRFPSPDPCPSAEWLFTAFDDDSTSASGEWRKSGLSNGAFEGRRIALPDGPEIHYFYPPWAGAGAWVTLVGKNLDMDLVNDSLTLGLGGELLVPERATEGTIRLRLPGAPGSSQAFRLTTYEGTALSPLPLNTGVENPDTGYQQSISLGSSNARPVSVVFSINNRRAFVANRGNSSVSMINTDFGEEFISTTVTADWLVQVSLHALAAAPDGRRIYAAGDNVVAILHAHTLELLDSLELPAYGSAQGNPQGIVISPDGRWLLLSEAAPGGKVTVLDLEDNNRVADSLVMPAGSTPRGLAIHPNGRYAYIALSGSVGNIQVYDLVDGRLLAPIDVGADSMAVALTPDGENLLTVSSASDTLQSYRFDTETVTTYNLAPNSSPTALAVSPDGQRVFINSSEFSIEVVDILTASQFSVYVGDATASIAVSRDGRRAYVVQPGLNRLVEIGNQRTLRISKQGGGVGTVRTSPDAIVCGTQCSATFDAGTPVVLSASPASGFRFESWGGDADCRDGRLNMSKNLFCVARFEKIPPPPPPPGGGGSGGDPAGGVSNCFIATAAYGSWLEPEVMTLRSFRDRYLLTNRPGQYFVEFYYRHSPPVADYIRDREALRAMIRGLLGALIFVIEQPHTTIAILWLLLLLTIQRSSRRQLVANGVGIFDEAAVQSPRRRVMGRVSSGV